MSQPRPAEHESTESFCCEANVIIDRLTMQNFKKFAAQTFQSAPAHRSEGKKSHEGLSYQCVLQ
jgi:hypothetical protein